jgi:hypothetical protein
VLYGLEEDAAIELLRTKKRFYAPLPFSAWPIRPLDADEAKAGTLVEDYQTHRRTRKFCCKYKNL